MILAKRSIRGDPNEVYPQCYKNISDRDKFDKKWIKLNIYFYQEHHLIEHQTIIL